MPKMQEQPIQHVCPACGARMHFTTRSIYRCEKCLHFDQDMMRQDILERDNPSNLKICECDYCLSQKS